MKYYLIFLLDGKVTSISRFDEYSARDETLKFYTENMYMYNDYNELQTVDGVY